jgi:high-affinity iron transporter
MLATLLIVFREVLEAGLVVGIVLAAAKGVSGRGLWVGGGVLGGLIGASLVAAFAGGLSSLFQGSGQELFNAAVLLLAVIMLGWHNVWMASHGRAMAHEMRQVGGQVASGRRPLTALAVVVGVAVLREGAEVVLFLYGIAGAGGTTMPGMLAGGALGILAGAAMAGLIYAGLLAVPVNRLFAATAGLITLLAAGMAAQAVLFLQQGGYLEGFSAPLWDSSWILSQDSIPGRMLHTLVGYSDSPDGAQLIAYGLTIAIILLLMRLLRPRRPAAGELRAGPA